ncbi:MAG: hypothetical protein OEM50_02795 [Gammaproteobacteria bacterium]|nr:hypothetical protein [Gammaproteobacteria bacterium]
MKRLRVPIVLAVCLCITTIVAAADGPLTLRANESSAQLVPRKQGPQQVSLPSLEFSLVATVDCPSDADVEAVTVSIADTHKHFGPAEIGDEAALDVRIRVPANQVAPIAIADFCIDGGAGDEKGLLVPGIATAQASLRCRSETGLSVYFASTVLPLRLDCAPAENQEASTER